jgi:mannose-1-phosphate guanylyltransferase
MKAILLAAGFGTRLRPLTDHLPKCLVPIGGEPLLGIWLRQLIAAGVDEFLVNTHYLRDQVVAYLNSNSLRTRVVFEPVLLGTAGTLLENLDFFGGNDGLLIHADNWCLANLPEFIAAHRARQTCCTMTMLGFRTETPSSCGILETNADGVVIGFHEKVVNPPGNLANGAVYLLSPEFLVEMRSRFAGATDFSTQVLPYFVGRIQVHETAAHFLDIGTPESYARAQELALSILLKT